tara:strand:+ start:1551 stop:2102 length:552 start_codon:yes stop_codon:yes gene_type:complete
MSDTRIELILGCMFAGKSEELLRRTSRYTAIGKKVLLINHINDTRTDNSIKTHSNLKTSAIKVNLLVPLIDTELFKEAYVIGIDEAQFFKDLYIFVTMAEKHNKIIIISGLDGDYNRKPIGEVLSIIPLCDSVIKLSAYDMLDKDGSSAIFTQRTVNDTQQILIGDSNKYMAVNRKNYLYSNN